MTLEEFDSLTRKRISRIIRLREKKLEKENEVKQQQLKEAERRAASQQRNQNKGGKTSQRVKY